VGTGLVGSKEYVTDDSALSGGFARHPKTGKPIATHPYKDAVDATRYLHDNLQGSTADWMQKLQAIAKQDCAW